MINWSMTLALLFLLVPVAEAPRLLKLRSTRDTVVFGILWTIAFAAIGAEWLGLPMPRPLDWIRAATRPLSGLLS
ncbi:hypothetical protein ACFFNY_31940 [Paenibacillus hodogayensis]|uniref:Uncharacterized protein n=1 Tax=Paenibacillus hodogayensis TaxID=279208 RepID=A0ABV5W6L5_9BACL